MGRNEKTEMIARRPARAPTHPGELMREITDREVDGWPVGRPFPLRLRTQAITLEVIMRAVFGVDDAERLDRLRDALSPLLDMGTNQLAMVSIAFPIMRRTLGKRVWVHAHAASAVRARNRELALTPPVTVQFFNLYFTAAFCSFSTKTSTMAS